MNYITKSGLSNIELFALQVYCSPQFGGRASHILNFNYYCVPMPWHHAINKIIFN